jgi:hypothetical protein
MNNHPLHEAYERTSFWVFTSPTDRFVIRCGERSEALECLLAAAGARHWAYITACNPRSIPLSDEENARRMAALEDRVRQRGMRYLHGEGIGEGGEWPPERSILIVGVSQDEASAIARECEQNALVCGISGEPAMLVWVDGTHGTLGSPGR